MARRAAALIALAAAVPASARVFHASPDGAGGSSNAASVQDCVDALTAPGDKCLLAAGTYRLPSTVSIAGKHGTAAKPMVIAAEPGAKVLFDGTAAVTTAWEQAPGGNPHIFQTPLPSPPPVQLFVDGVMQTSARWPNAQWADRSVFDGPERWAHSVHQRGAAKARHDTHSGGGLLVDAGACNASTPCCDACNDNDLAASGINATGALLIANLWKCDTGVQVVTSHTPGSFELHYDATWPGYCDKYQGGKGIYHLEGLRSFLDAPTEWWVSDQHLFLWPSDGRSPEGRDVRSKVQTWAFSLTDSSHLVIANMSFHATAPVTNDGSAGGVVAATDVTFESLDLAFPTSSRRADRSRGHKADLSPPVGMTMWSGSGEPSRDNPPPATGITYRDVAWRYADGPPLLHQGSGVLMENCLFEWNDPSNVASDEPNKYGPNNQPTVRLHYMTDVVVRRSSWRQNGNAIGLVVSHSADVSLIDFATTRMNQLDGCFVETSGPDCANLHHIWAHDSGVKALRFDANYQRGTANGVMSHVVAWNVSQLMVKGDNHTITNNTVFDAPADLTFDYRPSSLPRAQTASSVLDNPTVPSVVMGVGVPQTPAANNHTLVANNYFDLVVGHNVGGVPTKPQGQFVDNLVAAEPGHTPPLDVRAELRDPFNRDFRPCPGSRAARAGVGAYPPEDDAASRDVYWIPGRQEALPSMPSPRDGATAAKRDAQLLFLGGYRATRHSVWLGSDAGSLKLVAELQGDANVVRLPELLSAGALYVWRVDAHGYGGADAALNRTGELWRFTVGAEVACP